ncbi:MAG: hypothetical protein M0Z78_04485 [Betaproteobacteria bacterium]|jgi:hypothetical protein|nr:hypothetical protein [Betaproteobacteria bacterium]
MDIQTIDQQYQQLQMQGQQVAQQMQALAGKLQNAAQAGHPDAREWLLDLREVALAIQGQQQQMGNTLQAIHAFWQNQAAMPGPAPGSYPNAGYAPPMATAPQQGGLFGALGGLLNSNFGRAMEMGAGFELGEDLLNKIL